MPRCQVMFADQFNRLAPQNAQRGQTILDAVCEGCLAIRSAAVTANIASER